MAHNIQTSMLRCPICASEQNCSRNLLWKNNVWKSVACRKCGAHSSSARWHCACDVTWLDCTKHRHLGFAAGQRTRVHKKAPLRILPDMRAAPRKVKASPKSYATGMKKRRSHAKAPCPSHSQDGAIGLDLGVNRPPNSGSLSWLRCRPLKPGSVAWLVAIRDASSGQRALDMQAAPVSTERRSPCDTYAK